VLAVEMVAVLAVEMAEMVVEMAVVEVDNDYC
jgi:hypothetical protein